MTHLTTKREANFFMITLVCFSRIPDHSYQSNNRKSLPTTVLSGNGEYREPFTISPSVTIAKVSRVVATWQVDTKHRSVFNDFEKSMWSWEVAIDT